MTANCPQCQNPLPPDFGLVCCGHCGASVMLDENGEISSSVAEKDPIETAFDSEVAETTDQVSYFDEPSSEEHLAVFEPEEPIDSHSEADEFSELNSEVSGSAQTPDDHFAMSLDEVSSGESMEFDTSEPSPAEPVDLEQVAGETVFGDGDELNFEVAEKEPSKSLEDLSDLADFGNSELSQANEGSLYYSVVIDGIDSVESRSTLKGEFQDPRFMWDVEQLMREIRSGRLVLQHVPAVKASLLIQKLLRTPLVLSWSQHLLQAEANFEET